MESWPENNDLFGFRMTSYLKFLLNNNVYLINYCCNSLKQLKMEPNPNLDPICELFRRGDPEYRSISPLAKLWVPFSGGVIGAAAVLMTNWFSRKPLMSGVQRLVISTGAGVIVGAYLMEQRRIMLAEKDLQFYHYMTLHPEDFAPRERVKYKDYLGEWVPIR